MNCLVFMLLLRPLSLVISNRLFDQLITSVITGSAPSPPPDSA